MPQLLSSSGAAEESTSSLEDVHWLMYLQSHIGTEGARALSWAYSDISMFAPKIDMVNIAEKIYALRNHPLARWSVSDIVLPLWLDQSILLESLSRLAAGSVGQRPTSD
jgi:hypothetical protein